MLGKIKEGMTNLAQDMANTQKEKEEKIKELFASEVTDTNGYIVGIAQMEWEEKSARAAAADIFTNSVLLNWKDHIVGINPNTRDLIILEITDDKISKKYNFSGTYQVKKDTLIGNEIKNTLKKAFKIRSRRSGDHLGRDTFTIKDENSKVVLLIGNYLNEGTNYPYDNNELTAVLKHFKK